MNAISQLQHKVRVAPGLQRHNLTIFPLIDLMAPAEAAYLPFGVAQKSGLIRVTEVTEGGSVPQLAVETTGDFAVLLLDGEELIGARQNRIVNLTILVAAQKTVIIPVSCVERGRWSYRSQEFAESPRTMYPRARAKKMMNVSASLKSAGTRQSDQAEVWADVDRRASELAFSSATSAMSDIFEHHDVSIEEYLHDPTWLDGQVGAAFAIDGCIFGLDVFDSQNVARAYLPKVIRSYALDAIAHRSLNRSRSGGEAPVGIPDADDVSSLLNQVSEVHGESFPAVGMGTDFRIDSREIAGAALIVEDRVVHLSAFRKEGIATSAK